MAKDVDDALTDDHPYPRRDEYGRGARLQARAGRRQTLRPRRLLKHDTLTCINRVQKSSFGKSEGFLRAQLSYL